MVLFCANIVIEPISRRTKINNLLTITYLSSILNLNEKYDAEKHIRFNQKREKIKRNNILSRIILFITHLFGLHPLNAWIFIIMLV